MHRIQRHYFAEDSADAVVPFELSHQASVYVAICLLILLACLPRALPYIDPNRILHPGTWGVGVDGYISVCLIVVATPDVALLIGSGRGLP